MALGLYDLGSTTVYAARRDPRFSYCLYVPPGFRAAAQPPELVVVVHGSPRTFMAFRDRFQDFGDAHNALIFCPLFPVGPNGDGNADGYKYLVEPGLRYDQILLDMVAEVAERWALSVPPVRVVRLLGRRAVRQSLPAAAAQACGRLDRRARSVTLLTDSRRLVGRRARPPGEARHRPEPRGARASRADARRRGRSGHRRNHPSRGRPLLDADANDRGCHSAGTPGSASSVASRGGVKVSHEVVAGVGHDPWPIIERAKLFLAEQLS